VHKKLSSSDLQFCSVRRLAPFGRVWEMKLDNGLSLVVYPKFGKVCCRVFNFYPNDSDMVKVASLFHLKVRNEYGYKIGADTVLSLCSILY
jgi:hypothetical protein